MNIMGGIALDNRHSLAIGHLSAFGAPLSRERSLCTLYFIMQFSGGLEWGSDQSRFV